MLGGPTLPRECSARPSAVIDGDLCSQHIVGLPGQSRLTGGACPRFTFALLCAFMAL